MLFAGTLIIKDGNVLLVQEAHTEAYGLWSLPMGSVELNERPEDAAIRETKEETGFNVKVTRSKVLNLSGEELKCLSRFNHEKIDFHVFEGEIVSGELSKGHDILDAKWFPINDIKTLELRGQWVLNFAQNGIV